MPTGHREHPSFTIVSLSASQFVDERPEMLADIRPNDEHAAEHLPRNPMVTITQCVPDFSEHEANTVAVVYTNRAMSHAEGGWPKDVDYTEAEHTIRHDRAERISVCGALCACRAYPWMPCGGNSVHVKPISHDGACSCAGTGKRWKRTKTTSRQW